MKIVYTKHAFKKFRDLELLGVKISKKDIKRILEYPEHVDIKTDKPNRLTSGNCGQNRILRIVNRIEDRGIILVITFYPAKKGRYF